MLVASDVFSGSDGQAQNRGKGDAFMLVAATIFGVGEYCDCKYVIRRFTNDGQ